ncbi:STS14 protein [Linum grandiflorum]
MASSSTITILPLLIIILALCHVSTHDAATTSPPPPPPLPLSTAAREFLEAHNQARAAVGVGPLTWSHSLTAAAGKTARMQRDKTNCEFANLTNSKYGGNQMWASGSGVTPRMVVDSWVAEKKYYDHRTNTCQPGHMCGVYTQVVWRKSTELGCASATCSQKNLTICFYNPPGNFVGESPY